MTRDAERRICPLYSHLASPLPLQNTELKLTLLDIGGWAMNRSHILILFSWELMLSQGFIYLPILQGYCEDQMREGAENVL